MSGGLMQLVAYGAQDVFLTGNPQITFFKVVYRRYTNFAMEVVELTLNGNPDFGRKSTVTITRNGDLITKLYLRVEINPLTASRVERDEFSKMAWVRRLGHALIDNVEIEIGGSRIDKHYGHWIDVWYELTHSISQERGYARMIGDVPELTALSSRQGTSSTFKDSYVMFVPLQFWFCRNTGLALPLIALQYHEVRINFEFSNSNRLYIHSGVIGTPSVSMQDATLLVDYVYLDTEERRRFAQVGHEYLIEQLQFTGEESAIQKSVKVKLGFNHPCKELVWAVRNGTYFPSSVNPNAFLGYTETNDWSAAIQMAADNVATGMVMISSTADISAQTEWIGINLTTPASSQGPSTSGLSQVEYVVNGHIINVDLVIAAGTTTTVALRREILMVGEIDYGTKINAMRIEILNASTYKVSVTEHTFTIRDISVAISDFTDKRRHTMGATGADAASHNAYYIYDTYLFQYNNYGVYIDGSLNPIDQAVIQLNGHDRFDIREGAYFNYIQPYQHHTNTPTDGINVYSFALHPEQHQPSGTANLSRIDTTQLNLYFVDVLKQGLVPIKLLNNDTNLYIYATNYNVLRIMSGMGGLAYSN
jgi:hypothetical protein